MGISSEITALNVEIAKCFNSLATFTPATGSAVSLRVELEKAVNPQPTGYDGMTWNQQTTIECLLADLPAEPNSGETFKISGTTYTVASVIDNDGYFVTCAVK